MQYVPRMPRGDGSGEARQAGPGRAGYSAQFSIAYTRVRGGEYGEIPGCGHHGEHHVGAA